MGDTSFCSCLEISSQSCFWGVFGSYGYLFFVNWESFFRSDRKKTVAGNKPVEKPLHCHEDVFLHGLGALGLWGYAPSWTSGEEFYP